MICGLYGKKFIHNLEVTYDGELYQARIHVHDNMWCPIVITLLTENLEEFLEHICKELSDRQLIRSEYVLVKLIPGHNY